MHKSNLGSGRATTFLAKNFLNKLEPGVRQRYLEKISTVGIDPVLIEIKNFNQTPSTDLLSYLVLETSFYTQEQFKAFRSLEAYNQMVTGFIKSILKSLVILAI